VTGALTRYRVMAYVVGVGLIVLVCIGLPLKYVGDSPGLVQVVGPLHGAFFVLYVLAAGDLLLVRARWSLFATVLVMVAGTIPFLSFVAERQVTRRLAAGDVATPSR
jgi:integral membrane protein